MTRCTHCDHCVRYFEHHLRDAAGNLFHLACYHEAHQLHAEDYELEARRHQAALDADPRDAITYFITKGR